MFKNRKSNQCSKLPSLTSDELLTHYVRGNGFKFEASIKAEIATNSAFAQYSYFIDEISASVRRSHDAFADDISNVFLKPNNIHRIIFTQTTALKQRIMLFYI